MTTPPQERPAARPPSRPSGSAPVPVAPSRPSGSASVPGTPHRTAGQPPAVPSTPAVPPTPAVPLTPPRAGQRPVVPPVPRADQRPDPGQPREPVRPAAAPVLPGPAVAAPRKRRRQALLATLAAVLVLVVTVTGVLAARPGPVADWLAEPTAGPGTAAETSEPAPSPVLAAATADGPAPTARGIRAAIDKLVTGGGLGTRVNVSVVDVATGQSLYGRSPEALTTPASTTKLVTAATVLAARGPAYRIPTRVVAGATPGEVVIVGGGDPTLAVRAAGTYPGAARLDRLAAQVKKALRGVAPTKVIVDSSLFTGPVYGPGWDADIPTGGFAGPIVALMTDGGRIDPKQRSAAERYAKPDLAAGQAFARALGLPDAAVRAVKRGRAPVEATPGGDPPDPTASSAVRPGGPGTELGRVESPPMVRLVELMLADSDNVIAEALARQVALARGGPASYAGAAEAMDAALTDLGLPAAESAVADGSGLSRNNRVTPSLLTDLLALAASGQRPELTGLFAGLPVAGWSGTLRGRFASPGVDSRRGAGVVRAKTGTLSGINTISGVVVTADGRLLAFAVLADRVPLGADDAARALDRIPAELATCGCR